MTDYISFINDTANLVLAQLPLQSLDSANSLVYAYISDVGGWVPADPLHPYGEGAPANGFTEQQAADAITSNEINSCYDFEFHVTTTIRVQVIARLTDGLSLPTAAASMVNQVANFVQDTINNSSTPLRALSTGTQTTVNANSLQGGYTTQTVRQNIETESTSSPATKNVDYKALALSYVQGIYGLDDTWNVWAVYTIPDNPITVLIKKYTDDTYATLDSGSSRVYVINVSPVTYQVVAGVIID